jgi:hypothetical protein
MTPQADAFLAALTALCQAHGLEFYVTSTWPEMVFGIGPLSDPARPLYGTTWRDDTAAVPEDHPGPLRR